LSNFLPIHEAQSLCATGSKALLPLTVKRLVLLHGFIKKQQVTPKPDLDLAKE
jgi:hypothetical protein